MRGCRDGRQPDFALIAVGRESAQVDDVFVREQFARVRSVKEFVVVGKERLDTGRMDELQPNGTVAFVPKDTDIAVAPQSARDHQVVHQVETCGIGVGSLHESVAEVVVLSFATASSTAIEVQRERSDRFERIRTQAQTAVRFNAPSSVIYGWCVASATVSAVMTLFTAASSSADEMSRRSPLCKNENHFTVACLYPRQTYQSG